MTILHQRGFSKYLYSIRKTFSFHDESVVLVSTGSNGQLQIIGFDEQSVVGAGFPLQMLLHISAGISGPP